MAVDTVYVYTYYCIMNLTLSADEALIEKARKYAVSRNTTLNQLVRDYLARLVGEGSAEEAAREFAAIAQTMGGYSPEGWRFERKKIHRSQDDS